MGLLVQLATLPLAPVRSVVWLADRLAAEAERQLADPSVVRGELAALAAAYDRGELDDAEYDALEKDLLRRMRQVTHVLNCEGGR